MPFTLSHPAAVLPLLRPPFVPSALIAGAMAPDVPYFLGAAGINSASAQDWYGPFLNATNTHALSWTGLTADLFFTLTLMSAYRLLRGPVTALLPTGTGLPNPGPRARSRYLLLSALIGIATHLAWDSFTHGDGFLVTHTALLRAPAVAGLSVARLLQYLSTAGGLAAIAAHLWRHRERLRTGGDDAVVRLRPAVRWSVVGALVGAAVLGGTVQARGDFRQYRYESVADLGHPIVRRHSDGSVETSYPTRTVKAPWGTVAEGVLTGAAKTGGAGAAVALLLFAGGWHVRRLRGAPGTASTPGSGSASV